MREANFAGMHRLPAFSQLVRALADGEPVGGGVRGHVTVEADPLEGAVGAFGLPALRLFELSRELREGKLHGVDALAELHKAKGHIRVLWQHLEHEGTLQKNV